MAAPTVIWRHYTGIANSDGICWVGTGNTFGTHAISAGGFAAADNDTSTDTNGNDASAQAPIVGNYPSYDPGTDTTYWNIGFGAAPGTQLRCHVFATV